MVEDLKSASADTAEQAAKELWDLSISNNAHKDKIVEEGALSMLVALLQHSSPKVAEDAAGVLQNLAAKHFKRYMFVEALTAP